MKEACNFFNDRNVLKKSFNAPEKKRKQNGQDDFEVLNGL